MERQSPTRGRCLIAHGGGALTVFRTRKVRRPSRTTEAPLPDARRLCVRTAFDPGCGLTSRTRVTASCGPSPTECDRLLTFEMFRQADRRTRRNRGDSEMTKFSESVNASHLVGSWIFFRGTNKDTGLRLASLQNGSRRKACLRTLKLSGQWRLVRRSSDERPFSSRT